jgi:hypothetical protein
VLKKLAIVTTVYSAIRGSSNLATRCYYMLDAPKKVSFCVKPEPEPEPVPIPDPKDVYEDANGFLYNVTSTYNGYGAEIVGYKGTSSNLNIPTMLGGYPVYSIADNAFSGCSTITSLRIDGIPSVGQKAFKGCQKLQQVDIYGSIMGIGSKAFADCTSLSQFVNWGIISSVSSDTFSGCSAFQAAYIYGISDQSLVTAFQNAPSKPQIYIYGLVN